MFLAIGVRFTRSETALASLLMGLMAAFALASGLLPLPSQAAPTNAQIYAWGDNNSGQLGDGTSGNQRNSPVPVTLATGVTPTAVAAGGSHSLAIGSDGKVYTWGLNGNGQLGDGSTTQHNSPVAITLATGVTATAISAGAAHSLAIGSDGKVYTWGDNGNGQLGNGTSGTNLTSPISVTLAPGVTATAIAAGGYHSLAVGSDGKVYAWGYNGNGQIGDGTSGTDRTSPVAVTLATGVRATTISAGTYFSLAVGSDGKVYTWGFNGSGQLGDGTTTQHTSPVAVTLAPSVTATTVAAGDAHSLAIGSDGKVYAWGYNGNGQLGDGSITQRTSPISVTLATGVRATTVAAGTFHSLAVGSDFKVYAWGDNSSEQLGDGTTTQHNSPIAVTLATRVRATAVFAGEFFSLATGIPTAPPTLNAAFGATSIQAGSTTSLTFIITNPNSSIAFTGLAFSTSLPSQLVVATPNGLTNTCGGRVTATAGSLSISLSGGTLAEGASCIIAFTVQGTTSGTTNVSVNGPGTISSTEGGTGVSSNTASLTINPGSTTTKVTSNPTPSGVGQSVTFTATVSPTTATGMVTFFEMIGSSPTSLGTAPLISGTAVFSTSTLSAGSHVIYANYPGNSNYSSSGSANITQVVSCLVVTATSDAGTGTSCGTLSYALSQPYTGSVPITISFALTGTNTITFTGPLTAMATVKAYVVLDGGRVGTDAPVVINGNNVSGDGLHLAGKNLLRNLTIEGFRGRELVTDSPGNRLQGVRVIHPTLA